MDTACNYIGRVVDVAVASETEGCAFDPRLDAMILPQHVDPPINWVVTWLWSIVKRLELSEIRRYNSLQIIIIIKKDFRNVNECSNFGSNFHTKTLLSKNY